MTSDSGLMGQYTDYPQAIQELLDQLHQMQQTPTAGHAAPTNWRHSSVTSATTPIDSAACWSATILQASLDSDALQVEQDLLVSHWPKALQNDGKVTVWVRTAQGVAVPVRVTYYRRKGKRRAGKRDAGVYAGLVSAGHLRSLHPGVGRRGQSVGGDAGFFG